MNIRQLLLCLLSFFFLTTNAQNSLKNNFLHTKTATEFFQVQREKKIGAKRMVRTEQISKTINVPGAGTLDNLLTHTEKNTITDLTITGNLDARDIRILRDSLVNLAVLDISAVTVVSYSGPGGTYYYETTYPANEIPESAFYTPGEKAGSIISGLTSITLPSTVTSVGSMAFAFCSSLTSISISAALTQIGMNAFLGSSAIIHVDPANPNYSSVDGILFDKAKTILIQCPISITGSYDIPSSVSIIAPYGFSFCDKLTSVNVPSTVESIGMYAFTGCSGMMNIVPTNKNYTSLDGVLFNKSVTTLLQCGTSKSGGYIIPATVDSINDNAFYNCSLMTSVSIPSSIISIADYAFFNCSGLMSITVNSLPVSLSSTYSVFYHVNTSTCILNVPFGAKSLYQSASGWNVFSNIVENIHGLILEKNKGILSSLAGSSTGIKISTNDAWTAVSNQSWLKVSPENGSGNDTIVVTAEANPAADNRIAIVTVSAEGIQPQTITITQAGIPKTINITAGRLSTVLTAPELSSIINIKITGTMDARDFKTLRDNMPSLNYLDISEATIAAYNGPLGTASGSSIYPANAIPDYAFNVGTSSQQFTLTSIKLPATINLIGNYAFYSCEALTEIVIPNSVTNIGSGGFGSCSNLVSVTLPNQLTSIENQAFTGCGFSDITIPTTVKTIGQYGFGYCKNLRSINIPNSVTSISGTAFESCTALTGLTIGNSVTYIGNSAFSGCSSLESVVLPNSVLTLDGFVFANCKKLKTVTLPNSLATIGFYSFNECTNLTGILIPNSVTKIDYSAFSNCISLTDINIPGSVTAIGNSAFSNCSGLKSLTVNSDVPVVLSTSYNVFSGINFNTCILNVPFSAKTAYSTAIQWKDFVNIVENSNGFTLETTAVNLPFNEGSLASVKVTSNNPWNVISDQGWLKVIPANGTGTNPITLTAEGNASFLARTATVTVSATGVVPRTIAVTQAAAPKIFNLTAGGLSTALTAVELSTLTSLALTGTIDARDFKTLRDNMPKLTYLDISAVNVVAYTGEGGTIGNYQNTYPANQIPNNALSTTYAGKFSLQTVLLPTSITSIGNFAFQFCAGLTSLVIPESVKTIGYYAFASCSSLNSIILPSMITRIEPNTFSKCSKLTTVTIPASITDIGFNAFEYCTALTAITIPGSVINIGMNAFQYCSSLKEIAVPNTVKILGSDAFAYCSSLTNVTLPDSITGIASSTFAFCKELAYINIPNAVKIIDTDAFEGCSKLETINFGSAVQTLGYGVFQTCIALKQISIPTTVTLIGNSAFMKCTALTDITIPNSVTSIGSDAFNGCSALKEISIPNSVSKVSMQTFANCSGLKKVTLGSSLTSIESSAFYYCTALDSLIIPDPVTIIGGSAFGYCKSLKKVTIGNSLNSIAAGGFGNCYALNNVTLPLSLTSIGSNAFEFCSSLTEIIIPNSVTTLGEETFRGCEKLQKVVNSNSVKNIPSMVFADCSNLTTIHIGSSVVSIGKLAFDFCASLNHLTLPPSLQLIGDYSFRYCISLDTLSIPGSVTSIGESAFQSCTGLKAIYANRLVPVDISKNPNVFNEVDKSTCILHVPYQTKSVYAVANQWKDFLSIVESPHGLVLNKYSLNISDKAGSSATVTIQSNTSWTAGSDQSWLTVTPNSGTGSNSILLTAEVNRMFTTRTAIITVQASGIEPQLVTVTQDAVTKTVTVSAGGLSSALTPEEQSIVSRLAINGTLDATDFRFMRDSIPNLEYLDIRQSGIVAYRGNMGTGGSYTISYPEATIPQHAFSINYSSNDVMALKSILLPTSITSIGGGAFEYCYKLDSIKIPDSVTSIGDFAFESCKGLKNIVLSNSLTDIGQIFGNCVSLTTVIIPNSVITIANYAFVNCSGLSTLTIPGNVSSIGSYAFSCSGLTSIVSVSTIPLSLSNYGVFSNVNKSTCILSVPTGSKVLYQAAYQWKDFLNIIEMITAVSDVTESNVSIYPNPVKETFRITGLNETAHIILTDINGKQVVNRQVGADEKIPVGELTEGIYILRIVTSDGILVRKLIKE